MTARAHNIRAVEHSTPSKSQSDPTTKAEKEHPKIAPTLAMYSIRFPHPQQGLRAVKSELVACVRREARRLETDGPVS